MADPRRKKAKGGKGPGLALVDALPSPSAEHGGLVFWTQHEKRVPVDLREFVHGRYDAAEGKVGERLWGGDFDGIPELTYQLAPYIHAAWVSLAPGTVDQKKKHLYAWWRLFKKHRAIAPINTVEDLDGDTYQGFARLAQISGEPVSTFLTVVNAYREAHDMPELAWVGLENSDTPSPAKEQPSEKEVKPLYHELVHRYYAILKRWEDADAEARAGTDYSADLLKDDLWTGCLPTTADLHATYRGLAERMKYPCPGRRSVCEFLKVPERKLNALSPFAIPAAGLYPTKDDIQVFFNLFLLKTGWNAATAREVDAATGIEKHPTAPMYHVVRGRKERAGGTYQVAVGSEKSQIAPGNILRALIKRTAPLRKQVEIELGSVRKKLEDVPQDHRLLEEETRLQEMTTNPWLYWWPTRGIHVLDERSSTFMQDLVREVNERLPEERKIKINVTSSDFRDAYISFAYRRSGYNWLMAKLAAGHESITALQHYLKSRQWKEHSIRKVAIFSKAMWDEIRNRRVVDASILRAMVERGDITEEQRLRLEKHRTIAGMGCKSFTKPPVQIAPEHKEGSGCRVQRCILCPHGVIFQDSLDHIARRVAELHDIKTNHTSLVAWHDSLFKLELANGEETLQVNFDAALVKERVDYWTNQIASGAHKSIIMEGAYA